MRAPARVESKPRWETTVTVHTSRFALLVAFRIEAKRRKKSPRQDSQPFLDRRSRRLGSFTVLPQ